MCVKLPLRDLNLGLYPLHPTSTYTYEVTITPRVRKICQLTAFIFCAQFNEHKMLKRFITFMAINPLVIFKRFVYRNIIKSNLI